jgi:hypothetical protein
MNRRLYFMLPDVESAHVMMDEMLLRASTPTISISWRGRAPS